MTETAMRKTCPECGQAQVSAVVNSYVKTEHDYRCKNCCAKFQDPDESEVEIQPGNHGRLSALGQALADADPEADISEVEL